MIWEHYGPSHWVCKDFAHEGEDGLLSHGYVIHARCRPKRNMKTIFDKIPESWVEQLSLNGKKVAQFKKESHILDAMSKATSYVQTCLKIQEEVMRTNQPKVSEEDLEKIRKEFEECIKDAPKTYYTPIINSTESNN